MEDMTEIAGTGFFFTRMGDGMISFARMGEGEEMEELDPEGFATAFGSEVQSEEARREASSILNELNRTRKMNLSLAPFDDSMNEDSRPVQQQQEMNSVLGGMFQ